MKSNSGGPFQFLKPYLYRYRFRIMGGLGCVFISTALDQVSPFMIKLILDRLQEGQGWTGVLWPMAAMLGAISVSATLLYYQRLLVIQNSRRLEYEIRRDLFSRLLVQPKKFYDLVSIGDIMSRATNDLDRLRELVGPVILHLTRMILLFIYTAIAMILLEPKLALLGLVPALVLPLVANRFLKRMYHFFGEIQRDLSSLNSFVQDSLNGIHVVKAYGKEKEFLKTFTKSSAQLRDSSIRVALYNGAIWPGITMLGATGLLLVIWFGSQMAIDGTITIGTLSAIILYLLRVEFPLIGLGWVATMFQRAKAALNRIVELQNRFLRHENEINAIEAGAVLQNNPDHFESLSAQNLDFSYGSDTPVLSGINLKLNKGESLGIVGPIGSGKTTLAHLLCGVYHPKPGMLFLNGQDCSKYGPEEWKAFFGYVPQDGFLFSDTIQKNIEMGITPQSFHQVETAGQLSALEKDLDQLSSGYQSLLGEKGINLSGGQRQRVGLARALISNSPILVLDDTLSALDTETENQVIENLKTAFPDQTLVIVSHRYSAVRHCNEIVFLLDGSVVERGTHEQLVNLGGHYASIWEKQKLNLELMED